MHRSRRDVAKAAAHPLALAGLVADGARQGPALAPEPANAFFQRTWERTDEPVAATAVSRTWVWGPEPFSGPAGEPYADAATRLRATVDAMWQRL